MEEYSIRFRLTLAPYSEDTRYPLIPYDYQYSIASMFYSKIQEMDPEISSEIHQSKRYKPYTFSRLEIPKRRVTKKGIRILCNDTYLWFSSPNSSICTELAKILSPGNEINLGGLQFSIVETLLLGGSIPSTETITFTTLSPVILRTVIETNSGSKTWDLSPDEEQFAHNLTANLCRRFEAYIGRAPESKIEVTHIGNTFQKRIWIKNTSHRAHLMDISLEGSEDILNFAYDAGLGEKTAMGFGMIGLRS